MKTNIQTRLTYQRIAWLALFLVSLTACGAGQSEKEDPMTASSSLTPSSQPVSSVSSVNSSETSTSNAVSSASMTSTATISSTSSKFAASSLAISSSSKSSSSMVPTSSSSISSSSKSSTMSSSVSSSSLLSSSSKSSSTSSMPSSSSKSSSSSSIATGAWTNATSNLAGTPSDCGTVPYVTTKPDENLLIIGVVTQGVFASNNGGNSWFKLGQGAGSSAFTAGLSLVQFDPLNSSVWWLSGVRFGTPYKTLDKGNTFQKLADFPLNDGIAVDFSDPDRKTIVLGGHEQVQEVEYSADGGLTWVNIGANLPPNSGHSSYPVVIDANTFLIGTSNNEIYRTTNKGANWTKVANGGGGAMPLKHSDGSFYWASRDTSGLWRSTDKGETWHQVTANGIVYGMTPIELPDHRIVMRSPTGMLVSSDQGINWRPITPPIPNDYFWYVSTYSVQEKAFFTTRFSCDGSKVVNADAVMRYSWDYTID